MVFDDTFEVILATMELDCFKDNCMPSDLSKCGGKMDRCVGGIQPVFEMGSLLVLSRSVVSDSLRPRGLWPARLLCPWNSPGKIVE